MSSTFLPTILAWFVLFLVAASRLYTSAGVQALAVLHCGMFKMPGGAPQGFAPAGTDIAFCSNPLPKGEPPRIGRAIWISLCLNAFALFLSNQYFGIFLAPLMSFGIAILVPIAAGRWPLLFGLFLGPWYFVLILAYTFISYSPDQWKTFGNPVLNWFSLFTLASGVAGAFLITVVWEMKRLAGRGKESESTATPRMQNRRSVQFSVRWLIVLMTLVALPLGYHARYGVAKQRMIKAMETKGGFVTFLGEDPSEPRSHTMGIRLRQFVSTLIRPVLGRAYFLPIEHVSLGGSWSAEELVDLQEASAARMVTFSHWKPPADAPHSLPVFIHAIGVCISKGGQPPFAKHFPNASSIQVIEAELDPPFLQDVLSMPSLQSIQLDRCRASFLSQGGFEFKVMGAMRNIQVSGLPASKQLLQSLRFERDAPKEVVLTDCTLSDEDVLWICQTMHPTGLVLQDCELTETLIPKLGSSVVGIRKLYLDIRQVKEATILSLPSMPDLESIDIPGMRKTAAVLDKLREYPKLPKHLWNFPPEPAQP
jgi:hypothetical protein